MPCTWRRWGPGWPEGIRCRRRAAAGEEAAAAACSGWRPRWSLSSCSGGALDRGQLLDEVKVGPAPGLIEPRRKFRGGRLDAVGERREESPGEQRRVGVVLAAGHALGEGLVPHRQLRRERADVAIQLPRAERV